MAVVARLPPPINACALQKTADLQRAVDGTWDHCPATFLVSSRALCCLG